MEKLSELKNWIKFIHDYLPVVIGIEIICVILSNIASNQVHSFSSPWFLLILFTSIVYGVIQFGRYKFQQKFPLTVVENIEAQLSLENNKKDFSKITLLNETISNTLVSLNSQTCELQNESSAKEQGEYLCSQGISTGLNILLSNFVKNLPIFLESINCKITVGIYFSSYYFFQEKKMEFFDELEKDGAFIFKDDLNIESNFPAGFFESQDAKDIALDIQSSIRYTLNNNKFLHKKVESNQSLTTINSYIPLFCNDDDAIGVLFIISDKSEVVPNETEDILKIFSRIISNWISKYDECVYHKYYYKYGELKHREN